MEHQPLVSVIVVTYNSADWVLETLESIKAQTYGNIELIITDDCSTDNTAVIVKDWLVISRERFPQSAFVSTAKNSGISANCNRGLSAARGQYIKMIAGDDMLVADCIDFNLDNIKGALLLCSTLLFKKDEVISPMHPYVLKDIADFFSQPEERRVKRYMREPIFLNTPTFFFRKEIFDKIGVFDEQLILLEDQPFICKALAAGCPMKFVNRVTVIYRTSATSVTGERSLAFMKSTLYCYEHYRRTFLKLTNFVDALVIMESAIVYLLLNERFYNPRMFARVKSFFPSRIFIETDFAKRFLRKLALPGLLVRKKIGHYEGS
jgi:glycosyltransferase involved in cell wall biosynthesis